MRIRSIKPEFWRSTDVADLSIPDRLLFVGIWSYVDDNGVGVDRDSLIAADLFADDLSRDPRETLARVSGGLAKLSERFLISRYTVANRRFLFVTGWPNHQRIDKPAKPRYPLPNGETRFATTEDNFLARPSRECRESVAKLSETLAPGTGEQGNRGTGEQGNRIEDASHLLVGENADDERGDVTALCEHLAARIVGNGSKPPTITKKWRDAARLMLDKDERTTDDVHRAIDWCQDDEFWRGNIGSMPKLREKYDQLRLAAQRKPSTPRHGLSDNQWQAAYDRAHARDQAEGLL